MKIDRKPDELLAAISEAESGTMTNGVLAVLLTAAKERAEQQRQAHLDFIAELERVPPRGVIQYAAVSLVYVRADRYGHFFQPGNGTEVAATDMPFAAWYLLAPVNEQHCTGGKHTFPPLEAMGEHQSCWCGLLTAWADAGKVD